MRLSTLGPVALSVALSVAVAAGQPPRRVRFEPGTTTAVLKGTVKETTDAEYLLRASRGQTMRLRVSSPDDEAMSFYLYRPDGKLVDDLATANATEWTGALPDTGDYKIVVMGYNGDDDRTLHHYTLEVTVE
jgi:hypothetical protein